MNDPLIFSLVLILLAALGLYVGVRLLWAAVPWAGLWRGAVMATPVIGLCVYHTPTAPGIAVATLVSAAVLAVTLGLGVSTIDLPVAEADGSPTLRTLLPLAAVTCLVGFHGDLKWWHALALLAVGGLTLWTADGERRSARSPAMPVLALPAAVLIAAGLVGLVWGVTVFTSLGRAAAFTPVIVLLTVPAVLLALLGLLTSEAREQTPETPHETVVGLTAACLGIGLPIVIAASLGFEALAWKVLALTPPAGGVATQPVMSAIVSSTQPATPPAVVMPLATWRIDSVLLVVVSVLLLPLGFGRFKIGRAEGAWLIVLYLAYAAVSTRAVTGG
ncbi:MAG: hypothetical protein QM754_13995 [Tepidisphaeraceae bacterium]